jgi:tetratricopeptide (TPR) repeat protein
MQSDSDNIAVYIGTDQALSLLAHPPGERAEALEKYPKLDVAPPSLIFELILNLSEAGDFDRAAKLFHNRFFAREEGGTNVRQVWIEVQLQGATALAKEGKCPDALTAAQNLGAAVPDLPFTHDGLDPILKSSRTSYLLGSVYTTCNKPEEAKKNFEAAASASAPDQVHWAWLSAQQLPNFNKAEWHSRLQAALVQAEGRSETSAYPSWWFYTAGTLQRELGREQEADQSFKKALLLPDRMLSYHFTRLALSQAKP